MAETITLTKTELKAWIDELSNVGCAFWACRGPKEPEYMITCRTCWVVHNMTKRLEESVE